MGAPRVVRALALFILICSPGLLAAQEQPPPPEKVSEQRAGAGFAERERELDELRSEVVDLRRRLDEVQPPRGPFNYQGAALTFLLTTGVVAGSYAVADLTYGEQTRELMPGLTPGRVIGFGALAAAGPALIAGVGSGLDNTAIVSAGMTLDVLLALVPWGVGALANGITSSKYYTR